MLTEPLPCIACGTTIGPVWNDGGSQPDGAVTFSSPGQYGSTVFDPFDGSKLVVNVCDVCLTKAAERQQVGIYRNTVPVLANGGQVGWRTSRQRNVTFWNLEDDDVTIPHEITRENFDDPETWEGVELNEGFSPSTVKQILDGDT